MDFTCYYSDSKHCFAVRNNETEPKKIMNELRDEGTYFTFVDDPLKAEDVKAMKKIISELSQRVQDKIDLHNMKGFIKALHLLDNRKVISCYPLRFEEFYGVECYVWGKGSLYFNEYRLKSVAFKQCVDIFKYEKELGELIETVLGFDAGSFECDDYMAQWYGAFGFLDNED